jgi:hypothetical protein
LRYRFILKLSPVLQSASAFQINFSVPQNRVVMFSDRIVVTPLPI